MDKIVVRSSHNLSLFVGLLGLLGCWVVIEAKGFRGFPACGAVSPELARGGGPDVSLGRHVATESEAAPAQYLHQADCALTSDILFC